MSFPLYNTIINNNIFKKKKLSIANKKDFINMLKDISDETNELIYALIKYHHIIKNQNGDHLYDSIIKINETSKLQDITFDLKFIPDSLLVILYKFILMNKKNVLISN